MAKILGVEIRRTLQLVVRDGYGRVISVEEAPRGSKAGDTVGDATSAMDGNGAMVETRLRLAREVRPRRKMSTRTTG